MSEYKFINKKSYNNKVLVCPACTEVLTQVDISSFGSCPYCNVELKATPELEDYLLKPAVDYWVNSETKSLPREFSTLILPNDKLYM